MPEKVNVLLPVESINRELDFKLLLAILYSNRGHNVYVGQHDYLHDILLPKLRGGIYVGKNLFKTHFPTSTERHRVLRERGFITVHLDEEGGVYPNNDPAHWKKLLSKRLDVNALADTDYICTWGEFQNQYYASLRPELSESIITTGHPRFDLCKPALNGIYKSEVKELQKRFSKFILINTNLTLANNVHGFDEALNGFIYKSLNLEDDPMYFINQWGHTNHTLINFVKLVFRLHLELPEYRIILRPHPSESHDFYKTAFKRLGNVHVIHEGPVNPWIIASEVMIHDGCTTAIEAYFARKLVINFKSTEDPRYEYFISSNIGDFKAVDEDAVVSFIKGNGMHRHQRSALPEVSKELLYNLEQDDSYMKLMQCMDNAVRKLKGGSKNLSDIELKSVNRKFQFLWNARARIRSFFPAKQREFMSYQRQFGKLEKKQILQKLETMQQVVDTKIAEPLVFDRVVAFR